MRITVLEFDADDHAAIAAITAALARGTQPVAVPSRSVVVEPALEVVEETSLSAPLADTWNWLVAHDQAEGRSLTDIADGLAVTRHTVTWRMKQLIGKGVAYRVRRGRFRAGEGA